MPIAPILRRKRDEIAATIAVYEARIEAARTDLIALDKAARMFDPEGNGDETALNREFERMGKRKETPAAEDDAWGSERAPAMGQLALPVARASGSHDQDVESIGVQKPQFAGEVAYPATHRTAEQIPAEFFYFNWP